MPGTDEAFSRVKNDAQVKNQGWDVLDTHAEARFVETAVSIEPGVAQQGAFLRDAEASPRALLALAISGQLTAPSMSVKVVAA